jgi:hypothetical protein
LRDVFGDVPHQICEFHVIKELTKAILRAVARVRKQLAAYHCGLFAIATRCQVGQSNGVCDQQGVNP